LPLLKSMGKMAERSRSLLSSNALANNLLDELAPVGRDQLTSLDLVRLAATDEPIDVIQKVLRQGDGHL